MEASGVPHLLSGRGWPKASKSVWLTGEPLRFACKRLGQRGAEAGSSWARRPGGHGGFLRAGGSCPPESQEERDVCTSAWRASPWQSAAKDLVIALPILCLLHSVLGLGGSHERGTWQDSCRRGTALHLRPPVACGCGNPGVSEVTGGTVPSQCGQGIGFC